MRTASQIYREVAGIKDNNGDNSSFEERESKIEQSFAKLDRLIKWGSRHILDSQNKPIPPPPKRKPKRKGRRK